MSSASAATSRSALARASPAVAGELAARLVEVAAQRVLALAGVDELDLEVADEPEHALGGAGGIGGDGSTRGAGRAASATRRLIFSSRSRRERTSSGELAASCSADRSRASTRSAADAASLRSG